MVALAEALASLALDDERLGVLEGRGPVETMVKSLGHQGPGGGVVPALALVHVEEDLYTLFLLDAMLEHARRAALNELVVDDSIGGRPALHLLGLGLVHGEYYVLQEC